MFPLAHEVLQYLTRKKAPVLFNDLSRPQPVSPIFGLDRGTPVDRYYIENFLNRHSEMVQGDVLEVGDDNYTRRFGAGRVKSSSVLHATPGNRKATLVADLTDNKTLPENAYDCFICSQTFNFIFAVSAAVHGAHHVLRPGGVLLATVMGISQISRYDMDRWGDYWRFTTASIRKLLSPVFKNGIEITAHGNAMAACAFLQGVAVEDLPDEKVLDEHDPNYQLVLTIVARK